MKVVCVVDDEPSVRKGIANLLKSAGYRCPCFASGQALLASPWRHRADALLLDLCMPGLHGFEVLRRLREQGVTLPAICMSAQATEQSEGEARAAGARAFLAKPFSADLLLCTLARVLEEPR